MKRHPDQQLVCRDGVVRFRANAIVRFLLNTSAFDLNRLAVMDFPREDWVQFAQLTGYSLDGFAELSYVQPDEFERAAQQDVEET